EPQQGRVDGTSDREGRIAAGLRKGAGRVSGARLCKRVVLLDRKFVAQPYAALEQRRVRARAADGAVRVGERGDGLAEAGAARDVVGQKRRIRLLALVIRGRGLQGQALQEARGDRGLEAANAIVGAVRGEGEIAKLAGIEERELNVVPVFLVDGSIELDAVVEECGLPADLLVGQG